MSAHLGFRMLAPLLATGVLAGGALFVGMRLGPVVDGYGGEVGTVIAVAGVLACVGLLAWAWRALAGGRDAVIAAVVTGLLAVPATLLFTALVAATPIDTLVCTDGPHEWWCGLGLLFVIPTVGAVVPWTIAGLPGMVIVWSSYRNHLPGNR
jgi:hypothetical protein